MRLVIEHANGLMMITGVTEGVLPAVLEGPFQIYPNPKIFKWASMVKVTPRYALYRERLDEPGESEEQTAI